MLEKFRSVIIQRGFNNIVNKQWEKLYSEGQGSVSDMLFGFALNFFLDAIFEACFIPIIMVFRGKDHDWSQEAYQS